MTTTDYICSNPACDTDNFPGALATAVADPGAPAASKPPRCPACGSPGKLLAG